MGNTAEIREAPFRTTEETDVVAYQALSMAAVGEGEIEHRQLEPGQTAVVQLFLAEPVVATNAQPLVLRPR